MLRESSGCRCRRSLNPQRTTLEREGALNFEDEPYVRLYTRDTKTWLRLGFEGQTVLSLTMRKLDRAGVIDDIDDPATDVALLIGAPVEFVRVGLTRLIERDVFRLSGNQLVMPNFVQAQNCKKSDRLRQEDSRAKRRAGALSGTSQRDPVSQDVTDRHDSSQVSQIVTPSCAVPSSAEPSRAPSAVLAEPGTRTLDVPKCDPHPQYLEQALMAGVSRDVATETWEYWKGKGLPRDGVRDLYGWLIGRAKARGSAPAATSSRTTADDRLQRQADRITRLREQEALEDQ